MKNSILIITVVVAGITALAIGFSPGKPSTTTRIASASSVDNSQREDLDNLGVATFAGGCFWCVEAMFEKLDGVVEAISGYAGGHTENPTYSEVGGGATGHTESVQVYYDPLKISYAELLHYFWREIDPTDSDGQFVDRGSEYRPAIFYHNENEKNLATSSKEKLVESNRYQDAEITIEIVPFEKFYEAEVYHQDYYKTNPIRYKLYRHGSGRDQFLEMVWGDDLNQEFDIASSKSLSAGSSDAYQKPTDTEIRNSLTELQYQVTQHDGTEPPFQNTYWDNKEEGIYVDIVSGEPLFSSTAKYRSGTGWPSFWEPIDESFIVQKTDYKLLFPRTEVRSKFGDSHLGHVFNDGPEPTGLRYCINSAALKFIRKEALDSEGYGKYLALFNSN